MGGGGGDGGRMEGLHKWPGQAMVLYSSFFSEYYSLSYNKGYVSVRGGWGGGGEMSARSPCA